MLLSFILSAILEERKSCMNQMLSIYSLEGVDQLFTLLNPKQTFGGNNILHP